MKYPLAVFDLDGTLLDTLADLGNSANRALAAMGFPRHPLPAYRYFVGNGVEMLIRRAVPPGTDESAVQRTLALFSEDYQAHCQDCTAPYPGVPELLRALAGGGVRLAVLSNKPHRHVGPILSRYFPETKFFSAAGQRPGVPRKPDPAGALAIAAAASVPPGKTFYAGDSGVDMQTARAAGMAACGVLWGFREEAELRENGAQMLAARPEDILEMFRGEPA